MPARTQLFDTKNKPLHSFGSDPRNFLLYQPQGKLLLSAGFGNLAGGVDVWDMSTRNKVAEFKWVTCPALAVSSTLPMSLGPHTVPGGLVSSCMQDVTDLTGLPTARTASGPRVGGTS